MRQTYERQATFEPPVRRRLVTLTAGIFTLAAISCGYNIAASGLLNVLKPNYSWFRQEYGRYEVRQQNKSVVRSRSPSEPQLVGDFFFFGEKSPGSSLVVGSVAVSISGRSLRKEIGFDK